MRLQTFGIELSLEMDCWPELVVPEQVECELTDEENFENIPHLWFIYHDTEKLSLQDIVWFLDNQFSERINIYADGYLWKRAKVLGYKKYRKDHPFLSVEIQTIEGF